MCSNNYVLKLFTLIVTALSVLSGVLGSEACCPDGWTHYFTDCYFFGHHDMTFVESERFCEHYGAHLVTIESEIENNFIASVLEELNSAKHWIGLTDEIVEGVWRWYSEDIVANYTDWYAGEPNGHSHENCAGIVNSAPYAYHWIDYSCTLMHRPICEKRLETESSIVGK